LYNEDLALLRERTWALLLERAPASLRSYTLLMRVAGGIPLPRDLRAPVLGWIASQLGVDLSDAEHPLVEYPCFHDLFVRRLQPGARPVDGSSDSVVSPVDARVSTRGIVDHGALVQAKGIDYPLADLVDDPALAAQLDGGAYVTLYLRPHDYHRIHCPLDAEVVSVRSIAGTFFPVKPYMVRSLRGLFCRNERVVIQLQTAMGRVVLVCVAAAGVGTITVAADAPQHLAKGDELAAFNIGSTVILLTEPNQVILEPLVEGQEIRMGQVVARRGGP
jgi:phosphatidylserine decarboxylase